MTGPTRELYGFELEPVVRDRIASLDWPGWAGLGVAAEEAEQSLLG